MNLRILKKKAKRAREILIRDHGWSPSDFVSADGELSVDKPTSLKSKSRVQVHLRWCTPLRGTPLYHDGGDESDFKLPQFELESIRIYSSKEHSDWVDTQCRAWENSCEAQ